MQSHFRVLCYTCCMQMKPRVNPNRICFNCDQSFFSGDQNSYLCDDCLFSDISPLNEPKKHFLSEPFSMPNQFSVSFQKNTKSAEEKYKNDREGIVSRFFHLSTQKKINSLIKVMSKRIKLMPSDVWPSCRQEIKVYFSSLEFKYRHKQHFELLCASLAVGNRAILQDIATEDVLQNMIQYLECCSKEMNHKPCYNLFRAALMCNHVSLINRMWLNVFIQRGILAFTKGGEDAASLNRYNLMRAIIAHGDKGLIGDCLDLDIAKYFIGQFVDGVCIPRASNNQERQNGVPSFSASIDVLSGSSSDVKSYFKNKFPSLSAL